MSLLDRYFLHPIQVAATGTLHEVSHVVSPVVHAIEGPVNNIVHDSVAVVGGLYRVTQGVTHMLPYFVGGWLLYTAVEQYLPDEFDALRRGVDRAAKRMRLR